eukprot:Skav212538  [mRNA]  locus=scaffold1851:246803:257130:- [translate_table: standard]
MSIALTNLLDDLRGHVEAEILAGSFARLSDHAGTNAVSELLGEVPAGIGVHHFGALLRHGGGVHIGTHQKDRHVGVDQHLQVHLVDGLVLCHVVRLVDHHESIHGLIVDQVFQCGGQNGELVKSKTAALETIFEERQHEGWHVIFKDFLR